MNNLIIIDGPRCSGKTLLVENIVKSAHDHDLGHVQKVKMQRPTNPFLQMHEFLCEVERTPELTYVVDRFSLTELVMSIAHNRVKDVDLLYYRTNTIHHRLHEIGALYIVLQVHETELERRMEDRIGDRSWDMPKQDIVPAWNSAFDTYKSFGVVRMPNMNVDNMRVIMNRAGEYINDFGKP